MPDVPTYFTNSPCCSLLDCSMACVALPSLGPPAGICHPRGDTGSLFRFHHDSPISAHCDVASEGLHWSVTTRSTYRHLPTAVKALACSTSIVTSSSPNKPVSIVPSRLRDAEITRPTYRHPSINRVSAGCGGILSRRE